MKEERYQSSGDYVARVQASPLPLVLTHLPRPKFLLLLQTIVYLSVAQPIYTRGTLNIVEASWRHTNPILHIVRGGWFMALIGRDFFL
jgi:hypothetical protein